MKTIEVSKVDLEKRYAEMTVGEICEHYGITRPTLYVLLDSAGIPRKLPRTREAVRPILVD